MNKITASARARVTRDELVRAAAEVFFELGYAATSIDAIIARAGGSKRNIYDEFGSKDGLFAAIVSENAERALSALTIDNPQTVDVREALMRFGCRLMEVYTSPSVLAILRVVLTEGARFPDLAGKFYESGPGRASASLGQVLESAQRRGAIRPGNCEAAADHFVGMIRGNLHLQVALGLRAPPGADEVRAVVESIVDIFLEGIANRADRQR